MAHFTLFLVSFLIFQVTAKTKLKDLIPLCSKTDPNFSECAKVSGQLYINEMVKGIKGFGLPSIDPLNIPFMELSQSYNPNGLRLNVSDTIHTGLKKIKIQNIKLDDEKNDLEVDLSVPRYQVDGICDVDGKVLKLSISGHGPCSLSALNFRVKVIMDGDKETKNGKVYLKSKYQVKHQYSKGEFKLTGLFGGNPELGATMNRFLNENSLEILNDMKPVLEDVWTQIVGGIVDKLLKNVPYDELFLK